MVALRGDSGRTRGWAGFHGASLHVWKCARWYRRDPLRGPLSRAAICGRVLQWMRDEIGGATLKESIRSNECEAVAKSVSAWPSRSRCRTDLGGLGIRVREKTSPIGSAERFDA